jgi:hypothetical protein
MRKTALLTGVAGLLLMTAPAFAQDGTAPQTPPTTPASPAADPNAPQSLTLQPGASVKGSDGAVLGQLEGARNGPAGQELTVRGPDGQLRAVPVSGGVRQDGADIAVGWSSGQFQAAPAISDPAAAPAPDETAPAPMPSPAPTPAEPTTAPDAASPPADETEPMAPPSAAAPTPTDPADPARTQEPMTPDQPGG